MSTPFDLTSSHTAIPSRVAVDMEEKLIYNNLNGDNSEEAVRTYNEIPIVSEMFQKIADACSQIKIELQDGDEVTITDKDIKARYHDFLRNIYRLNGNSRNYPVLIAQIVSSLLLVNEYFLRLTIIKGSIVAIEFVAPQHCYHYDTNSDGYVDEFHISYSKKGTNVTQVFQSIDKRIGVCESLFVHSHYIPKENKELNFMPEGTKEYLLHFLIPNHIQNININTVNFLRDTIHEIPQRGISRLHLIKPLLQEYGRLETQKAYYNSPIGYVRSFTLVNSDIVDGGNAVSAKTVANGKNNTPSSSIFTKQFISTGNKTHKDLVTVVDRMIDFRKDYELVIERSEKLKHEIARTLGIPEILLSTGGATYNNLSVAMDDTEKYTLSYVKGIVDFLNSQIQAIPDLKEFKEKNYQFAINTESSDILRKRRKEDLEVLASVSPTNEMRVDILGKDPVQGGDVIGAEGNAKHTTGNDQEKNIKNKKNTGQYGDRQVKKK